MSSLSGVNKPSSQYQPRPHVPSAPSSRVIYDPVTDKPQTIIDVTAEGDVTVTDARTGEITQGKVERGITADRISIPELGIGAQGSKIKSESVHFKQQQYGETPETRTTEYEGGTYQEENLITGESQFYRRQPASQSGKQSLSSVFSPSALEASRTSFEGAPGSSSYQERFKPVGDVGLVDVFGQQSVSFGGRRAEPGYIPSLNLEQAFASRPQYRTIEVPTRSGAELDALGMTSGQKLMFMEEPKGLPLKVGAFESFMGSKYGIPLQKSKMLQVGMAEWSFVKGQHRKGQRQLNAMFSFTDKGMDTFSNKFLYGDAKTVIPQSYKFLKGSIMETYEKPYILPMARAGGAILGGVFKIGTSSGSSHVRKWTKGITAMMGIGYGAEVGAKAFSNPKEFGAVLGKEAPGFIGFTQGFKGGAEFVSKPRWTKTISLTRVKYAETSYKGKQVTDAMFGTEATVRSRSLAELLNFKSRETKYILPEGLGVSDVSPTGRAVFMGGNLEPVSSRLIQKRLRFGIKTETKPSSITTELFYSGVRVYYKGQKTEDILIPDKFLKEGTLGIYRPWSGETYYNAKEFQGLPLSFGLGERPGTTIPKTFQQYFNNPFTFESVALHEVGHRMQADYGSVIPKLYVKKFSKNRKVIKEFYEEQNYSPEYLRRKGALYGEFHADVFSYRTQRPGGVSFESEFEKMNWFKINTPQKYLFMHTFEKSSPLRIPKKELPFTLAMSERPGDNGGFLATMRTRLPSLKKESISLLSGTYDEGGASKYYSVSFSVAPEGKMFAPKNLKEFWGKRPEQAGVNAIRIDRTITSPEGEWKTTLYSQRSLGLDPYLKVARQGRFSTSPKIRIARSQRSPLTSLLINKRGFRYGSRQVLISEPKQVGDYGQYPSFRLEGSLFRMAAESNYRPARVSKAMGLLSFGETKSQKYPVGELVSVSSLRQVSPYKFKSEMRLKPELSFRNVLKNELRTENILKLSNRSEYSLKNELKLENVLKTENKIIQELKTNQKMKLDLKQQFKTKQRYGFIIPPPPTIKTPPPSLWFEGKHKRRKSLKRRSYPFGTKYRQSLAAKPFKVFAFKIPKRLMGIEIRPIIR